MLREIAFTFAVTVASARTFTLNITEISPLSLVLLLHLLSLPLLPYLQMYVAGPSFSPDIATRFQMQLHRQAHSGAAWRKHGFII